MVIDTIHGSSSSGSTTARGAGQLRHESIAPLTTTGTDQLRLSRASKQLQQLQTAAENHHPPVDQKRVETLRAAIADGSYQVNSNRLAANLLASESER